MYVIAEITRTAAISHYYSPTTWPFVVAYKFYYGANNIEIADFWKTTFNVTEEETTRIIVTGVVYNKSINYSEKDTFDDMLADVQSFYWNGSEQTLYVHYNLLHNINYLELNFDYGIAIGVTNDTVRYFENREYLPLLQDFPSVNITADNFNYDQLSFIVDTLTFNNFSGFFNQFKNTPIYGNRVSIKTGFDDDTYAQLIQRATYYVEDYNFSATLFTIDIQDIRKTLTVQVPNIILNTTDYPYVDDSNVGKVLPFGYGPLHDVPGLCLNAKEVAAAVSPVFRFLEIITGSTLADIKVYVKNTNDVWIEQTTGVSVDWLTGYVTVSGAKTLSGTTYDVLPVKADVNGVANTYGSDIIKDMNLRFLGLTYDNSNYDTTEWEIEEKFLSETSLYMDKTTDIYEWIKELQSLSSVGFSYTSTHNDKRTIRCDNPNRTEIAFVPSASVKNVSKVVAESNKDEVFNKVYIGYNKSILNETAPKVENIDYFDVSYSEYKIVRVYDKITGLKTEQLAIDRARLQAENYYQIHRVFQMDLIGEEYLDLRIYDILNIELSLAEKTFEIGDIFIEVLTGNIMQEVFQAPIYTEVRANINTQNIGDDYFGIVRGQVISIEPNYALKTNRIKLRQRDYSLIWEDIYG